MAEYWRFQERGAPVSAHVKRPRGEFEDMQLAGSNYLPREEPRYDARDARFSWMESNPLGMGLDGNRSMGLDGNRSMGLDGNRSMGLDVNRSMGLDVNRSMGLDGNRSMGLDGHRNMGLDGNRSMGLDGNRSMGLDGNRSMMAYAPGSITGSDITGAAGAPYIGLNGAGPLGDSKLGLSSLNDPSLAVQGWEAGSGRMMGGMDLGVQHGLNGGRLDHVPKPDPQIRGLPGPGIAPPDATHTLYVEGLPADCTRREAAHIFRPFLGFKEVRLVRKEGKRDGDQFVLCFVDFLDPKSASIALEALQGYKFDETERDSHSLRLQYSRFPGSRPGPRDGARGPRDRDALPPNRAFRR